LFAYGNDTGIGCRIYEALSLWHLGHPDRALRGADELVTLAYELSHPFTLVFALYFAAVLHQFRREVSPFQEKVEALLRISTEQGFALYLAWGTVLRGWALAKQGQEEQGIEEMHKGTAAMKAIRAEVMLTNLLAYLTEACGRAGRIEEGLRALGQGLAPARKTEERCWEAELHRLKGELLLTKGREGEAEACFQRAVDVARRQGARSWELRATTSLSRLWQGQGRPEEARAQLQKVSDWFTEGFGTADLREARALLEEMEPLRP
jgi:predicted ATPase